MKRQQMRLSLLYNSELIKRYNISDDYDLWLETALYP